MQRRSHAGRSPKVSLKCGALFGSSAERAEHKDPVRRENLAASAAMWTKLAAEFEADQLLLNALSELTSTTDCMQCQRL